MKKFEYKNLTPTEAGLKVGTKMEDVDLAKDLRHLTDKGWEIISFQPCLLVFKREIEVGTFEDDDRPVFTKGGAIKK